MILIKSILFNPVDLSASMGVPLAYIPRLFTNGRWLTFTMTPRLAADLGMKPLGGTNAPSHLVDESGECWAVRSFTGKPQGLAFCPNNLLGGSRRYDHQKFLDFLKTIAGYLVVDVTSFPTVNVYRLTDGEIQNLMNARVIDAGKISSSNFRALQPANAVTQTGSI